MKVPQVLNTGIDTVIAINGDNIINDSTQQKITAATIQVDVAVLNLKTNTVTTVTNITMTRNATVDVYTLNVSDLTSALTDRVGYIALVSENGGATNMRAFKFEDFSQDNDSFESVWMRLPYRVNIGGGQAWIEWHEDTTYSNMLFRARAYEGGTGTTDATLPERVTHRGPIEVYP